MMKKLLSTKWWVLLLLLIPAFAIKLIVSDGLNLKAQDHTLTVAPDFTAKGHDGKEYKLSDQRGKYVVLEWFNNRCPFVEKHYGTQNMQNLQKKYTDLGVVWFSVASSGISKNGKTMQGWLDEKLAKKVIKERGSKQTAILLDASGDIARSYKASTTPHMFVIDPNGNIIYQGAIDDQPSFKKSSVEGARNYVAEALDISMGKSERKKIEVSQKAPYGCGIKNNLDKAPSA